jgi:hypothetical protein
MYQEERGKHWREFLSKMEANNNELWKFNVVFVDDKRFNNFINHLKGTNRTEFDSDYSFRQCRFF